jgi:hypothetical protein
MKRLRCSVKRPASKDSEACMFGLWDRKGKSGEPLPEANHGRQIRIGHQACARTVTSNRASRQRVICPSHSTAEWLTRPVVRRLARPSTNAPPASAADIAAKDSSSQGSSRRLQKYSASIVISDLFATVWCSKGIRRLRRSVRTPQRGHGSARVARPGLQDVTVRGGRDYCVLRNSILQE